MAGHSKWSNIKRHKEAQDIKRGKIFMRHSREIHVAAKKGGGNPEENSALRLAIERAREVNMPNDNIQRAIDKATGNVKGKKFEDVIYEGYGPGGVAVMVEVLTDNRNRTAAEIRHAFSRNDGNLGESGSVSYMFARKGYIVILNKDTNIDEDEMTLHVIEAGAEDIDIQEDAYEVYTDPDQFHQVSFNLRQMGYELEEAEITYIPQNFNPIGDEEEKKMLALIDVLEELDDVQAIHHNLEITM